MKKTKRRSIIIKGDFFVFFKQLVEYEHAAFPFPCMGDFYETDNLRNHEIGLL